VISPGPSRPEQSLASRGAGRAIPRYAGRQNRERIEVGVWVRHSPGALFGCIRRRHAHPFAYFPAALAMAGAGLSSETFSAASTR
jgi:hypothetical protein